MIVIPAVDIKGGQCVRLRQGRMEEVSVFSPDPVEMALKWQELGAQRLHVVDLDGAVEGRRVNGKVIEKICSALTIPVELGGGIRGLEDIKAVFDMGVHWAILGTVAAKNPALALQAAERWPGRILVGIDAREGRVATQGWVEVTSRDYLSLARELDRPGVAGIIFTDISRDGMHTGINTSATARLCEAVSTPVIAAGGVHDLEDIRRLKAMEPLGLAGVIVGRALYEATLSLPEAIALATA